MTVSTGGSLSCSGEAASQTDNFAIEHQRHDAQRCQQEESRHQKAFLTELTKYIAAQFSKFVLINGMKTNQLIL